MSISILAAIILLAIFCVLGAIIIFDMHHFSISKYEIRSDKIKSKFSFAVLSDLHGKSYGGDNESLLNAIYGLSPDAVICTGDMYTSRPGRGYGAALKLVKALSQHYPIYLSDGNHEQKTSIEKHRFGDIYERYLKDLDCNNICYLTNKSIFLKEPNIEIWGITIGREFFKHFGNEKMPKGYVAGLLGQPDPKHFTLLLAHSPNYFEHYAKWGADLTLSGHIHGGIGRLPFLGGMISPGFMPFPHYDAGRFDIGNHTMIISRGLGTHTLPIRFLNQGDLMFVTLMPKDGDTDGH